MRYKLLLLILLLSSLSYGQQGGSVVLNWIDNVKSSVGETTIIMPQFQAENMSFNADNRSLNFIMNFPAQGPVSENSLVITNIAYENISAAQLGELSPAAVPATVNAKLSSARERGNWRGILTMASIVKDGAGFKRLKSFSYSYSTGFSAERTANSFNTITNSVLATGEWHRFYVERSGIYIVNRSFLQQLGFNVNVDPRNIKIFGNGGRMVPLLNSADYPADLAENAIQFIGEEDGSFDGGDYILFYAEGVDNWSEENGTHNNLYANRSYYYITSYGGPGKRIANMVQPTGSATITTNIFDEYQFYERDRVNIARLGRKWHGEEFNVENERDFDFNIPDLAPGDVRVTVSAASNAVANSTMEVKANGTPIGNLLFTPPATYSAARDAMFTGTAATTSGSLNINLIYNNAGIPGSNAWLDYIIVRAKRFLKGNGRQFRFRYNDAATNIGIIEYQFTNAAGIAEVWDITDIYNVTKTVNTGQAQFSFKAPMGEVKQYITRLNGDFYTPLREPNARVANQDLKGTVFRNAQGQFQDVDYIIVTPASLASAAERLANFHRADSQLRVKVISLESIYQEFSSGKQDIAAIRNFIKYVYNNASSPENRVKYVNLFGDASFDFKDRIPNNTNIVPIFHAYRPSGFDNYSIVTTFASDDFFVLMDPNEGRMTTSGELPDIAVGRMLVNNMSLANQMVDKVIEYKSEQAYGRWRNEYVIITDDIDASSDVNFVQTMENLATELSQNRKFINIRKIYTDSYVQQASSGGERYPEAKDQIIRAINFGTLVVNYLGHGGEDGMSSERIFERTDAQNLNNKYKYPLFITATCELTKFDNPYRPTTGEYLYWNPNGGAIAMITTTRGIFISDAFTSNEFLSRRLYNFNPTLPGDYPSMAEALRQTKAQNSEGFRVIAFVGDPALKLAIPKPNIVLTEINDVPAGSSTEILKSLSYVKLGGQVTDEAGNPMNNYNGELAVSVFDKPVSRQTLRNDGIGPTYNFNVLGETIFRGNATVTNGQFEFGFVVPRDIRIPVGEGRISFYAKRNNVLEDQNGFNNTIKIGGINPNAAIDNTPPKVRLYMNDETFISGGITNQSPIFLAFIEDENGINTASGIGHDIIAILDGDETNPFVLNDYYETTLDNYTKGNLRFPFNNLSPGLHTLTFKAWDVYNNLVTADIQFVVVNSQDMYIEKVLNYPNPFVSYTEFWFTHNRPFEPLDVQVQVLTVTGKVVKTINQSVTTDGFLCRQIKWDGRDDFGDRIGKGVYIYKLTVRSSTTNKTAEKYEKLVLL
ncbi:peptidase C25 [Flavobacterium cyanobacteriorum]|uniref:Peptidase C25 n=2 Tax=Flavobacterium cyanobacteriorum TaxID=2022802 RepID=A0A255ZJJ7_9FLAO|nr:peptidase C25 [Flavobacterium cyanobacteriorum]